MYIENRKKVNTQYSIVVQRILYRQFLAKNFNNWSDHQNSQRIKLAFDQMKQNELETKKEKHNMNETNDGVKISK